MPTYAYACTECDHRFEIVQAFTDQSLTVCPRCEGRLRKLFNSVGVVFKGSGFYRTDSRAGEKSGASAEGGKSESSTSEGGKSASGSSGSSEKKADSGTSASKSDSAKSTSSKSDSKSDSKSSNKPPK